MNQDQVTELILQSLEHEKGGVKVYETALRAAVNDDLRQEWEEYLEQTRNHEKILREVCEQLEIDPEGSTPGCEIIRFLGLSLVQAMEKALKSANTEAAQLVACECVVIAETKIIWTGSLSGSVPTSLVETRRRCCARRSKRWKTRKTSTSITQRDGVASCGFSRSACAPYCRRRRSGKT